jgi:hypothetical protein
MRFFLSLLAVTSCCFAQAPPPDWTRLQDETMRHFQAVLSADSSNPPGNEIRVVDYLKKTLEAEGIPVKTFALEESRPNLVARIKGSGKKRPPADSGAYGCGDGRCEEMEIPAVQRDEGWRLCLRARFGG